MILNTGIPCSFVGWYCWARSTDILLLSKEDLVKVTFVCRVYVIIALPNIESMRSLDPIVHILRVVKEIPIPVELRLLSFRQE